ncbi:phosphoesterase-domain-containing protein [Apiospora saccharicola]|uniref:Phosphoesterase-domain-containing protein n=1 Tax=Apiospora saccharicola TaxID=335842 RepID=A0ABR1U346_9PEZI
MGAGQSTSAGPWPTTYTATATASVAAARATALTLSPTSNVQGKTFDRFVQIWMENTDFDMAAGDPNLSFLATQGVTLTDYHGVTHPSQPNYVASVGGSHYHVITDGNYRIDADKKTVVDLLDAKNISWSVYGEDMPYSGFEADFVNQQNGANDYVRKHNPLMSYDSFTMDPNRLAKSKNLTMFYNELAADKLPQWMFITPNMTSDGHDTSVTTAGLWMRSFLTPLLADPKFNTNRTLVVVSFDETENYFSSNRVFTMLLGGAVRGKEGTKEGAKYNHYSGLKTVEQNWDLGDLGQNDVKAVAYF